MVKYKLVIEYIGTEFAGFQVQKGDLPTIQGELQAVLSKIFNIPVKVTGAGRTDAGVHALTQVVHFTADKDFPIDRLRRAINGNINKNIIVKKAEIAPEGFHARFSAKSRKYIYVVHNSPVPSAFYLNKAYWVYENLNFEAMKDACACLVGTHDFKRFVKKASDEETTVKTLDEAKIYSSAEITHDCPAYPIKRIFGNDPSLVFFYYSARSFLHSQVRLMTSNLLEVGKGRLIKEEIKKMLTGDETIKSNAPNIPGFGLYLMEVTY